MKKTLFFLCLLGTAFNAAAKIEFALDCENRFSTGSSYNIFFQLQNNAEMYDRNTFNPFNKSSPTKLRLTTFTRTNTSPTHYTYKQIQKSVGGENETYQLKRDTLEMIRLSDGRIWKCSILEDAQNKYSELSNTYKQRLRDEQESTKEKNIQQMNKNKI